MSGTISKQKPFKIVSQTTNQEVETKRAAESIVDFERSIHSTSTASTVSSSSSENNHIPRVLETLQSSTAAIRLSLKESKSSSLKKMSEERKNNNKYLSKESFLHPDYIAKKYGEFNEILLNHSATDDLTKENKNHHLDNLRRSVLVKLDKCLLVDQIGQVIYSITKKPYYHDFVINHSMWKVLEDKSRRKYEVLTALLKIDNVFPNISTPVSEEYRKGLYYLSQLLLHIEEEQEKLTTLG